MPRGAYYKGSGEKVMARMKKQYGADRAEDVFYATANKHPMFKPASEMKQSMKKAMQRGRKRTEKSRHTSD